MLCAAPVCQGGAGWPGLGAVHVATTLSTRQERGQPWPGNEGLLVPQWWRWEQGWGCSREILPCRAEGQQCQQWLQPDPEPLEVAREQGYTWIYGPSHDVYGWHEAAADAARPCPARRGSSLLCILVPTGWRFTGWTLLFEVELPRTLSGTTAVSAQCRATRQLLPARSAGRDPAGTP